MRRRCRPGQRARILTGWNRGKIVLVVRAYLGEEVSGAHWPTILYPWVVTSLSVPLRCCELHTMRERMPTMTIVDDDRDLQPLDDDDETWWTERELEKPKPVVV